MGGCGIEKKTHYKWEVNIIQDLQKELQVDMAQHPGLTLSTLNNIMLWASTPKDKVDVGHK